MTPLTIPIRQKLQLVLMGGLGNRLFIGAAAKFLQDKRGIDVELMWPGPKADVGLWRENGLVENSTLTLSPLSRVGRPQILALSLARHISQLSKGSPVSIGRTWAAEKSRVSTWEIPIEATLCASYFQLVPELGDSIRSLILGPIRNNGAPQLSLFAKDSGARELTVHVRGGDYFKSYRHRPLPALYYLRAIERLGFRNWDRVVVLNNDLALANQVRDALESKLGTTVPTYIENLDFRMNEIEALSYMSHAKNLITSNSTLSKIAGLMADVIGAENIVGLDSELDAGPVPESWIRVPETFESESS